MTASGTILSQEKQAELEKEARTGLDVMMLRKSLNRRRKAAELTADQHHLC